MPQEGGGRPDEVEDIRCHRIRGVRQYLDVVQRNQFVAVAAGVVVHQHTRVLVANLHRCGDDLSAEDVGAGVQ